MPIDQLKDASNSVITMFSSPSDDEHVIIEIFYHFQWYQPGDIWFQVKNGEKWLIFANLSSHKTPWLLKNLNILFWKMLKNISKTIQAVELS